MWKCCERYWMGSLVFGLLLFGLLPGMACTSTGEQVKDSPPPEWVRTPPSADGGSYFIGRADDAKSRTDARDMAKKRALAKVAEQFAVEVEGEVEISETQSSDSDYSYQIRQRTETETAPIAVRDFSVERSELRPAKQDTWRGWMMLHVPDEELARIERQLLKKTALYVNCEPTRYCPNDLHSRVRSIASQRYDWSFVADPVKKRPDTTSLNRVASQFDAAYFLDVQFRVVDTEQIDGEHFARVKLEWNRYDTDREKLIDSKVLGPQKGGHFSTAKAVKRGLDSLLERLEKGGPQ